MSTIQLFPAESRIAIKCLPLRTREDYIIASLSHIPNMRFSCTQDISRSHSVAIVRQDISWDPTHSVHQEPSVQLSHMHFGPQGYVYHWKWMCSWGLRLLSVNKFWGEQIQKLIVTPLFVLGKKIPWLAHYTEQRMEPPLIKPLPLLYNPPTNQPLWSSIIHK